MQCFTFLSGDRKQDATNTSANNNFLIPLLKEKKLLRPSLSTIWDNNDCAEQYRCASALYLILVMCQCYSVIIDQGIITPVHGKYFVDGINAVDKRYIYISIDDKCLTTLNKHI